MWRGIEFHFDLAGCRIFRKLLEVVIYPRLDSVAVFHFRLVQTVNVCTVCYRGRGFPVKVTPFGMVFCYTYFIKEVISLGEILAELILEREVRFKMSNFRVHHQV